MRVAVKYFSAFKTAPGAETWDLELPEGIRIFQLLKYLPAGVYRDETPMVGSLFMVNQSRANLETILRDGDDVFVFDVPGG